MARPTNAGLDYFPLDTDIDQDDKLALVEADFGIKGFGIVIKLLMKIYATSYYYKWGEKEQKLFSRRVNVDIDYLSDVVNATFKWEVFNSELYKEYGILTSRGVQKRYFEACVRRKEVEVSRNYLLLNRNEVEKYKNIVYVNINPASDAPNVNINSSSTIEDANTGTQSKVKESRVKESKENNSNKIDDVAVPLGDKAHEFYQQHFQIIESPIVSQNIDFWIKDLNEELVIEAMSRAALDQKKYKYAEGIMKNWDKAGIKTMDEVRSADIAFENSKKKTSYGGNTSIRKETLPDWAKDENQTVIETPMSEEQKAEFRERLEKIQNFDREKESQIESSLHEFKFESKKS